MSARMVCRGIRPTFFCFRPGHIGTTHNTRESNFDTLNIAIGKSFFNHLFRYSPEWQSFSSPSATIWAAIMALDSGDFNSFISIFNSSFQTDSLFFIKRTISSLSLVIPSPLRPIISPGRDDSIIILKIFTFLSISIEFTKHPFNLFLNIQKSKHRFSNFLYIWI